MGYPKRDNAGCLGMVIYLVCLLNSEIKSSKLKILTPSMRQISILLLFIFQLGVLAFSLIENQSIRKSYSLNEDWETIAADSITLNNGFEKEGFHTENWEKVNVPHNWDQYEGYRRLKHGNRHGYSWYRKNFEIEPQEIGKRYFLFFEGVGSYATVFLNGKKVGEHAGGRTTFTIDITESIHLNKSNLLAVRADHPSDIQDLPWVCGGCSDEYGFSEGSQPMGIFRPVQLIVTNPIRIEPFGVHVWNDTTVTESKAAIHISSEIRNYGSQTAKIVVVNELHDANGIVKTMSSSTLKIKPGESRVVLQNPDAFSQVKLWSTENPYLYTLVTEVYHGRELIDRVETPYGIRWVKWDVKENGTNQFYLNGKPVFINGTAEYEHNMGMSHAFTNEMVKARVSQMKSAGFNAFRDAHQPHNFRYHQAWDSLGMLWWTQMAAHIWYDTPAFRDNFKTLLKDWVKERRNSPSMILWGLENESTLPEDFAKECTQIIRALDRTSPSQRLVTTCNGGTGTDWNVPQNWTGTYGGKPELYHDDIQRQQLIGEYGAWRTLDLHSEGPFDQKGVLSEDRMTLLMEQKVWLADSVKDKTCGHFQWIFTSHENPGRNQSGEAFRELDRVGPVNYKGLFSPWGEPADVYYMYRANHVPKETEPMVYIVSHTWPNRWDGPGLKDSLVVYSNCDQVELFNGNRSLGRKNTPGFGKHFQWDSVFVQTSLIVAKGFVDGKIVGEDHVVFNHLIPDKQVYSIKGDEVKLSNDHSRNYLYRMNCGGPDYIDSNGNLWSADLPISKIDNGTYGSTSWTDDFRNMPAFFASQRRVFDPIFNVKDDQLFQTFRFGMKKLQFHFPVPDGGYEVELHFVEPWYGTGGGLNCEDWRNFDVAINDQVILDDLDIWSEIGHDQALIKIAKVHVTGGLLRVHFPEVKSGQAIISAIAISTSNKNIKPAQAPERIFKGQNLKSKTWLDWGDQIFTDAQYQTKYLPPELFGAEWIQLKSDQAAEGFSVDLKKEADVYVAFLKDQPIPEWLNDFDDTKTKVVLAGENRLVYDLYKKRLQVNTKLEFEPIKNASKRLYCVFANVATEMAPPYDLKPKTAYDEDVAILKTEGLSIEKLFGLGCVTVGNELKNAIQWPIKTGVADYHAIHFKYSNETSKEQKATFKLIAGDGTVMQESEIQLPISPSGKYLEVTTFTESMINAGDYFIQLELANAKGVSFRGIRVQ